MRRNNRNDFPNLNFILTISVFREAYLESIRRSMMVLSLITILQKRSIIGARLNSNLDSFQFVKHDVNFI